MSTQQPASSTSFAPTGNVVTDAQQWVAAKVPYLWGGVTKLGADCSGMIQNIFASEGVSIGRTTYEQVGEGSAVPVTGSGGVGSAVPGDVLFFDNNAHEALYAGNGLAIDEPHTGATAEEVPVTSIGIPDAIRNLGLTGSASGTSSNYLATIYDFFISKGLSPAQAAGATGNIETESGGNPEAVQSGGPGRGIAQWGGSRWQASLMTGDPETDLSNQLNYLWSELSSNPGYGLAALQGATSPTQAADIFSEDYERPQNPLGGGREANAQNIYNEAMSGTLGTGTTTGGTPAATTDSFWSDFIGGFNPAQEAVNGLAGGATSQAPADIGNSIVKAVAPVFIRVSIGLVGLILLAIGVNSLIKGSSQGPTSTVVDVVQAVPPTVSSGTGAVRRSVNAPSTNNTPHRAQPRSQGRPAALPVGQRRSQHNIKGGVEDVGKVGEVAAG